MCFKLSRSENLPPLFAFSFYLSLFRLSLSLSLFRAARSLLISGLFLAARVRFAGVKTSKGRGRVHRTAHLSPLIFKGRPLSRKLNMSLCVETLVKALETKARWLSYEPSVRGLHTCMYVYVSAVEIIIACFLDTT